MKIRFLVIGFVSLLLADFAVAQSAGKNVILKTNAEHSGFFVKDSLIAEGSELNLEEGKYNIRIVQNLYEWNSPFVTKIINTEKFRTPVVKVFFNKRFLIDSKPQDATVLKGDSVLGYTPLLLSKINGRKLTLQKAGYAKKIFSLSTTEKLYLTPLPSVQNQSFTDSKWFPVLLGSTTVFGATAAYFKLKADSQYDQYLATKDNEYLRKTNLYDLISGVALGVLEINFGFLIYYFLAE